MSRLPSQADKMKAFMASDPGAEGIFLVGVRTTRIFCRPTCTARKPLPRNVAFFATSAEAIAAGYRACKRCRPTDEFGPRAGGESPERGWRSSSPPASATRTSGLQDGN